MAQAGGQGADLPVRRDGDLGSEVAGAGEERLDSGQFQG